ncbi:hypothetical protein [Nocardioides marmotae]|uniref:DUF2330 domain-containing protein n=1 Tax=Nocardioides marmotae TaxID=2663857 RepID=A0A6I3J9Q2_9ACTN|nr:hypothetical protein [Nocardioides marmotae]MCR6030704.1 hypothetical protein [Gordonia jinghuaiqii]MBC9734028.1 hypothetical protein [Nocardioides marmotae]MTB85131.1 hypothetical protein [Nocardioides marmotae]MTB94338.1 hypothetical protein [Nocardioides marmotae]QKE01634.1 hypothetical protein HPC71_11485 [Nocardioides marmotae]
MTPRLPGARGGLVLAALAGSVLSAGPASAATTEAERLCRDDDVRCSVQVPSRWTDGATQRVGVTGRPEATVTVRAFRLSTSGGSVEWEAIGPEVEITTDEHGWGSADLALPTRPVGTHGGPLVVALAEAEGKDLSTVLGAWSELLTPVPEVLGDGYAESKPVGAPLGMALDHVVPGSTFAVERQDGSAWVAVPGEDGPGAEAAEATCDDVRCSIPYVVPRGLPDAATRFRLVDLRSGTPVTTWRVRPHAEGQARPTPRPEVFPALGAAVAGSLAAEVGVDGAAVVRPRSRNLDVPLPEAHGSYRSAGRDPGTHPVRTVQYVAAGAGALALALALGPGRIRRRR